VSWHTHFITVKVRHIARKFGLNRWIANTFFSKNYEQAFQHELLAAVQPGDIVWDIGANVGLYTLRFAELVGNRGKVVAFEPSTECCKLLRKVTENLQSIQIYNNALGETYGTVLLQQGQDETFATSRVIDKNVRDARTVQVEMLAGDSLIADGSLQVPNVLKIDTEGYELEVLRGLRNTIRQFEVRTVCVEVHFGILTERGLAEGPALIEQLLRESGLSCHWTDSSHLVAKRIIV